MCRTLKVWHIYPRRVDGTLILRMQLMFTDLKHIYQKKPQNEKF